MMITPEHRLSMEIWYSRITWSILLSVQPTHWLSLEYSNPPRLETKQRDLIHPIWRKPLLPIRTPCIPRFLRTKGSPGICKTIGLYEGGIFIQNGVEVSSNKPTACTTQERGNDGELLGSVGRSDG